MLTFILLVILYIMYICIDGCLKQTIEINCIEYLEFRILSRYNVINFMCHLLVDTSTTQMIEFYYTNTLSLATLLKKFA